MTKTKNVHAVALGRLGGKVKSPAKGAASAANGLKGGRPHNLRGGRKKKSAEIARGQEDR